ncbi:MAG: hypothetical protein IJW28_05200, partial [Clostridia bacterium]|nr:hypothetical protein [Clostridia bacterium]
MSENKLSLSFTATASTSGIYEINVIEQFLISVEYALYWEDYMIKEIIGELPVVYIADYNENAVVR